MQLQPDHPFPVDEWISYDLGLQTDMGNMQWLRETAPQLSYTDSQRPCFVVKSRIDQLLHGSCRNPHHEGGEGADGLLVVDKLLGHARAADASTSRQPALLLLTGDLRR